MDATMGACINLLSMVFLVCIVAGLLIVIWKTAMSCLLIWQHSTYHKSALQDVS